LTTIDDFDGVIELQRRIWRYSELELESRGILTVASRFSGQILGAFMDSQLIGFALAFANLTPGSLHSHRVGILPEHQNSGVGLALKLAQRDDALKQGLSHIHWTFDPLQPRNAYFNLHKLGASACEIYPNLYGLTTSPLQAGLPTDRVLLDWDLLSVRVNDSLSGKRALLAEEVMRVPLIAEDKLSMSENQRILRERLQNAFFTGMTLTDFERRGDVGDYILEKI